MLNSNRKMLGIMFPNSYDALLPDLVNVRMMGSIPFASRYRLIDFLLSSMTNCGIDNVSIMANNNYHSLMDHLESGREWDLVRKTGGLHIFPPYAEKSAKPYTSWVGGLASILGFLRSQNEKYVILTDANIVVNFDFRAMLDAHIESGADVSVAYNKQELPKSFMENLENDKGFFYTLGLDGSRVNKLFINPREKGVKDLCMNIVLIERELLIDLVNDAFVHGRELFIRDVLLPQLNKLNVQAYQYNGYVSRISDLKSYFDENMRLLDDHNLDALFSTFPVYTKIRDDTPTRYIEGSKVQNVMVADGCVIEGEVEDSIIFRGVKIAKGAKVKNCILMQGTVIESGANIEYLVADKSVVVTAGKEMKGTDTFPVYIGKHQTV